MIEKFEKMFGGYFEFKFEDASEYKNTLIITMNDEEKIPKALVEDLENNMVKFGLTVSDRGEWILMVWEL